MLAGGSRFLVDSKSIFLRTRYRIEVGPLFPQKYDPFGTFWVTHTPPKSMCTHRHSRQKFLPKKSRFSSPDDFGVSTSPIDVLRSKIVLNVFFGPLSISYDAWMMSHNKLKKLFLRLKIGPKMAIWRLFPLNLGVKFSKFFFAPNCIKT